MNYPGRPHVVSRVLKSRRVKTKRERDGSVRQTWPSIAGSPCGGRALWAKESGQNLETKEGRENQSLLVPPKKNAPI